MKSGMNATKWTTAIAVALCVALFGAVQSAQAADLVDCQNLPMVKNLRAYTARCNASAAVAHKSTKKEVKKPTAKAKPADDHLKLPRYDEAMAEWLDAQSAAYENAAGLSAALSLTAPAK